MALSLLARSASEAAAQAGNARRAAATAASIRSTRPLTREFRPGPVSEFEPAVSPARWHDMDDEAIIEELVGIRGIGRWTAEMFLIFHLLRPNVLPLDDVGLIKGISVNYFSGEPVSRAEAREVGDAWSPFLYVFCC